MNLSNTNNSDKTTVLNREKQQNMTHIQLLYWLSLSKIFPHNKIYYNPFSFKV
jgi:triacylglycerol esterase/lipase EstA (alpha/beta hydrolase family)